MKTAKSELNISVDVECPYCEHSHDLLQLSEFTDDGMIYDHVMPNDSPWSCTEPLNREFDCEECNETFLIGKIDY